MIPTPKIPGFTPIKRVHLPPRNVIVVEKFKLFIFVAYDYDDPFHSQINDLYDEISTFNPYCKDIKRLDTECTTHFKDLLSLN